MNGDLKMLCLYIYIFVFIVSVLLLIFCSVFGRDRIINDYASSAERRLKYS